MTSSTSEVLLQVENLQVNFHTKQGVIRAVDGLNLSIRRGETVCLVGESGCGKTVTGLALMRLIDEPGIITSESKIIFDGHDLLKISEKEMENIRGNEIGMVFQEPMSALNPVRTVGHQIAETVLLHENVSKKVARARSLEALELVGMPAPLERLDNFPHQMSGGMRQRVVIAMAIVCRPKLLIADEPTTALDVTVQAQIIELLDRLRAEFGMALLHITHDLGLVAETADQVAVAYGGRVVESGAASKIFQTPGHPYTQALLKSIPTLGPTYHQPLNVIQGMVPANSNWSTGCRFMDRCGHAFDACRNYPPVSALNTDQTVACWLPISQKNSTGAGHE